CFPQQKQTLDLISDAVVNIRGNVVSVVNLGCRLDLDLIARTAWNVVYSAQVSHMLTMRIRKPRTTANIFYTGKLVCTGATSMEESKVAARRFARIVQKLGFPVRFLNFRIQMIVATCDTFPVPFKIRQLKSIRGCISHNKQLTT
uniref:Uncharacterized protein n=1 Tax=Stegastes partitus TaxID=144197 RepID=A0A3B4ZGC7_9TELE